MVKERRLEREGDTEEEAVEECKLERGQRLKIKDREKRSGGVVRKGGKEIKGIKEAAKGKRGQKNEINLYANDEVSERHEEEKEDGLLEMETQRGGEQSRDLWQVVMEH